MSVPSFPCQDLLFLFFLIVAILTGVVLIFISLMIGNVEHLFIYLLAICVSSFEKCLLRSSAHFLIILLWFFLLLSYMNSLYIFDINPFSDTQFANIFSHLVGCLFISLMVSFPVLKLFTLTWSHLVSLLSVLN